MSRRTPKSVAITGLWLRREGNELVALVEVPSRHAGITNDWREVVRVVVNGEWEVSHIVESSGLLRYVSENYAALSPEPESES
jgi:hypothetical protein